MGKLFANNGDPDQTLHSAASDLGLHCLPVTLLGVSRLQWVNAAYSGHMEALLEIQFTGSFIGLHGLPETQL